MTVDSPLSAAVRRAIDIGVAVAGLGATAPLAPLTGRPSHGEQAPLRRLLRGELSLVGPEAEPDAEGESDGEVAAGPRPKPGLVTLHRLRQQANIAYDSPTQTNQEYLQRRGLAADAKLLARYLPALLLKGDAAPSSTLELLGVRMRTPTMSEAVDQLTELAQPGARPKSTVFFINPHCLNIATSDEAYREALDRATLLLPDGIGLQVAARLRGESLTENVNGTDLYPRLIARAADEGLSVFFFGAAPGVADEVAARAQADHPTLRVAGTQDGYYQREGLDDEAIVARINAAAPDIVLVALGVPRQELWLDRHRAQLDAPLALGVGGLFDFYSGRTPRAPQWVREFGLEWAYRLQHDPGRLWRRYVLGNPLFLARAVGEQLRRPRPATEAALERFARIDRRYSRIRLALGVAAKRGIWRGIVGATRAIKRGADIVGAGAGLVALAPLFGITAAALRIESPGPVFFSQIRVGRHGRTFTMWKFRSMVVDAEDRKESLTTDNESSAGVIFKIKDDPRITRVGRLIRKLSIDELPQLYNVLRGDMTLVGPRPPVPKEVAQYYLDERRRLDVEPGLTCLWQVGGRSDIDFDGQVRLDLEYIESRSLRTDLQILLRTVPAVLTGKGAY